MTTRAAKEILVGYRPGVPDEVDPPMAEALALAQQQPELAAWFVQHCAFQQAMRAKLRSAPVPAELRARLLAGRKVIRPGFWQRPSVWLAAAAALVLLLGLGAMLFRAPVPDRFADFRSRMVRVALREYRMDIVTNDMAQVRAFLASRGGPADYELKPGLAKLQLSGGGLLRWRGHPVSMVCFDRGDQEMLYLFVLGRGAAKDAPPSTPRVEQVNKLVTVSWSQGDKVYVLAGPEGGDFVRKYF